MRVTILCVLATLAVCQTLPPPYGDTTHQRKIKTSDKLHLQKQINIFRLFKSINHPCNCSDQVEIARNFLIEKRASDYTNTQAHEQFVVMFKKGMLPRGHIFSVLNDVHLKQVIAFFKLLYYAKDWDTFYKTAVWARVNINEGIFVYGFCVALAQRPDTYGMIVPPIYEIFPSSFFDSNVIEKIEHYKESLPQTSELHIHTEFANYSGYYLNLHPEQSLSYFTEDIGLNAFYWYTNVFYPFWLGGSEFKLRNDRRGEQHYYLLIQMLARYYLERLSNDMGDIPYLDYNEEVKTGYYPSLKYHNGLEFPSRPHFAHLNTNIRYYGQSWVWKSKYGWSDILVKDYERRIRDVIDYGLVPTKTGKLIDLYTPEGIDTLGNLIECNPDSPNTRFFGPMEIHARHLVGYAMHPLDNYHVAPSVLEHFETACRDPAFYQIYKRIVMLFQKYKTHLPPYSRKELIFPGVKISSVQVDKLITYFDYFESDVTNTIRMTPEEYERENVIMKIRQKRLNHKPFSYRIQVSSESDQEASIRVYIGPKHDEHGRLIDIQENRVNFVELDNFKHSLKTGENVIERNSRQFYWYVPDRTTFTDIYKKLLGVVNGGPDVQIDASEAFYGFPDRLMLPKGKPHGQMFQLLVCLNPYRAPSIQQTQQDKEYYFHRIGTGNNFVDNYAFGFPLDRLIDTTVFTVPNCVFQDVTIYLKTEDDRNTSQYQENLI